jgi:ribosomal protein S18 acetylase RimI-like enzyme
MDEALLTRVEDASLNAASTPLQWWQDGWIVRACPGKARRSRCINAVAEGRLPLDEKLDRALALYRAKALPALMRMTRFSRPESLEAELQDRAWTAIDDTRVLVCQDLRTPAIEPDLGLPAGTRWMELAAAPYAEAIGQLRGSPPAEREAQAQRLQHAPVRHRGYAIQRADDGTVLACGQFAREDELVGLFDVCTLASARGQGLAKMLCKRLLSLSVHEGATTAYLQVEANNTAAGRLYLGLGFSEGYAYHYRQAPAA